MITWQDECRRDDAIRRLDLTILIGCIGLILVGIIYAIWGVWIPTVIGVALSWCIVVGLPILFDRVRVLRDKVVDFLDKNWKIGKIGGSIYKQ